MSEIRKTEEGKFEVVSDDGSVIYTGETEEEAQKFIDSVELTPEVVPQVEETPVVEQPVEPTPEAPAESSGELATPEEAIAAQ